MRPGDRRLTFSEFYSGRPERRSNVERKVLGIDVHYRQNKVWLWVVFFLGGGGGGSLLFYVGNAFKNSLMPPPPLPLL